MAFPCLAGGLGRLWLLDSRMDWAARKASGRAPCGEGTCGKRPGLAESWRAGAGVPTLPERRIPLRRSHRTGGRALGWGEPVQGAAVEVDRAVRCAPLSLRHDP